MAERDQRRLEEALDKEWGRQHGNTQTKANTNAKLFRDSMYATFVKREYFQELLECGGRVEELDVIFIFVHRELQVK